MRLMTPRILPLIVSLMAISSAHAAVISQWTFETSIPTTKGPIAPELGNGSGTAYHANSTAVFSNPAGNGSGSLESWSATKWTAGDYWQFEVRTSGFESIFIGWDQLSSATGPRDFGLFYSTDGSTFAQFLINYTVTSLYSTFSRDLSSITGLNDDASVFFRLVDMTAMNVDPTMNGGTVALGGTDRVDNFTVSGNAIASVPDSAPGWLGLGTVVALLTFGLRRWEVKTL